MRTVDPSLWSRHTKGRKIQLARALRFGRPAGIEARLRGSLCDAMGEFWRNCSVEGVRRIASEQTSECERYRWMLLLSLSLVAGGCSLALTMSSMVTKPPLVITLQSAQHSIAKLPFPAVALCSVNVISRERLIIVANHIAKKDVNRTYTLQQIYKNLLDSGALLSLALIPVDLQFTNHIQTLGNLNITLLMLLLSPSCPSLLVKCSWGGKEKPCNRLFTARITSVGWCCVFNGRYEDGDRNTPPKILNVASQDNGLSVVIKEDDEDFLYLRRPSIGVEVLIFEGSEYPFLEGGSTSLQLAPRNMLSYYTITTRAQFASSNLDYLNEAWRGCRVPSSKANPPAWRRSYSWCLLECRRNVALQLCRCVPYTLQPRNERICGLSELSCLNKHKEKFMYYEPTGYTLEQPEGEALSEELQDGLYCPQCVADCARPVYVIKTSFATYPSKKDEIFQNRLMGGVGDIGNTSVLRFFYSSKDQFLYAVKCNYDWFETLANISSQWVFLLGISLVSVCELVFHGTVRWRHHYRRRAALATSVDSVTN